MSQGSIWESLDNVIKGIGSVAKTTMDTVSIFDDDDAEMVVNTTTQASLPAVIATPSVNYQGGFMPSNFNWVVPVAVLTVGAVILLKMVK